MSIFSGLFGGGGSVSGLSSGSGDLSTTVNLPVNSSVTFSFMVQIDPSAAGTLANTATVTLSGPNLVMSRININGTLNGAPTVTSDPQLGSLQNNGGPTQPLAVPATSSAYQAGTPVSGITTDQRGLPRSDTAPTLGAPDVSPGFVCRPRPAAGGPSRPVSPRTHSAARRSVP